MPFGRYIRWVLVCITVLPFMPACGGPEKAPADADVAAELKRDRPALVRFAHVAHGRRNLEPMALPLKGWEGQRDTEISISGGVLRATATGGPPRIRRAIEVEAAAYRWLAVEMQVSAGGGMAVSWRGPLEPGGGDPPLAEADVFPGPNTVMYKIPLEPASGLRWQGTITALILTLSDVPADATIHGITLLPDTAPAPPRMTIDDDTRQALYGRAHTFRFRVPGDAVIETWTGMAPRAWETLDSDGVRFRVLVQPQGGHTEQLLARAATPRSNAKDRRWRPHVFDLAPYSGQIVDLRLRIDPVNTTMGDYAYWGSPMLHTPGRADAATPVFLVSCDTLRAGRLSVYGHERPTSPELEAFAKESVVFDQAYSPAPWTLPGHMSMLTGLYEKHHGVTPNLNAPERIAMLPEILGEAGYLTAGFTGHKWWLLPWRGFGQGFDAYSIPAWYRGIFETEAPVRAWLRQHPVRNQFIFFHNYDVHSKLDGTLPYTPNDDRFRVFTDDLGAPPDFTAPGNPDKNPSEYLLGHNAGLYEVPAEEVPYLKALYDEAILKVDFALGTFFDQLEALGLYEEALIVVTSDHGEAFGEKDRFLHEDVYEGNLRVPLMIKFPGQRFAGRRISTPVSLIDLVPTVLDVLGLPSAAAMDGQSLLPLIAGKDAPQRLLFAQRRAFQTVRESRFKLIRSTQTGRMELYDIHNDPYEQTNLYNTGLPQTARLEKALEEFFTFEAHGWRLAFHPGKAGWSGTVRITPGLQIENVSIENGYLYESEMSGGDPEHYTAEVHVPAGPEPAVATVETRPPGIGIEVIVESETAFSVSFGETETGAANEHRLFLSKTETGHGKPPADPEGNGPAVRAWYSAPPIEPTAAQPLPPEAVEQLESLGYMQELEQ